MFIFAKNVKYFVNSSGSDPSFAGIKRYPTIVTFNPAGQGHQGPATFGMLSFYNWTRVTVLCDALSLYPSLTGFVSTGCRTVKSYLVPDRGFDAFYETFDSRRSLDYASMLKRASQRCRGQLNLLFICSFALRSCSVSVIHAKRLTSAVRLHTIVSKGLKLTTDHFIHGQLYICCTVEFAFGFWIPNSNNCLGLLKLLSAILLTPTMSRFQTVP